MCSKKIYYFLILIICKECNGNTLLSWFNRVKNPSFECPQRDVGQSNVFEAKNILRIVDCETPGARWDYKYKVKRGS